MAHIDCRKNVASDAEPGCGCDSECGCNPGGIDDAAFWEELNSLLIQMVCVIERQKLRSTHTTSELRKIGKAVLCKAGRT